MLRPGTSLHGLVGAGVTVLLATGCAVGSASPAASASAGKAQRACWQLQVAGQNLLGQALRVQRGAPVDRATMYRELVAFDNAAAALSALVPSRRAALASQPGIAQALAVAAATEDASGVSHQAQLLAASLAGTRC